MLLIQTAVQRFGWSCTRRGLQSMRYGSTLERKSKSNPNIWRSIRTGLCPLSSTNGIPIIESSVICEYLDEKYPQNSLVSVDLVQRARMRAWMHYIEEVAVAAIRVPSFNGHFFTASRARTR